MAIIELIEGLEQIEQAAQGNARLALIRNWDSPQLRWYLTHALSPDITFGIKKLPESSKGLSPFGSEVAWFHALGVLVDNLAKRKLTGHSATQEVAVFLGKCADSNESKWAERLLTQDLRINVGAKDVNKALGEEVIYLFAVPLATDYRKVKERDLAGEWVVQPKLDGGRCVAILGANGGPVRLLSRTGKEWGNFESIRRTLQQFNDSHNAPRPIYLDGEVVSLDHNDHIDFQLIQKTMMRKDGVEQGKLRFMVFDACEADEWRAPTSTYWDRYVNADSYVNLIQNSVNNDIVQLVPGELITNPNFPQLDQLCDMYSEGGYEGAMIRRAKEPVEAKRGKKLLKVKNFIDDEATVVSAVEGLGKYQGMLGCLRCVAKNGVAFEIGSGFNDAQRTEFWRQWTVEHELPENVSFKYQNLTDDDVPRFPIFRYFRSEDDL